MRRTAATLSLAAALLLAPAAPAFAEAPTGRIVTAVSAPTPTPTPDVDQPQAPKPEKSSGGWGLWGLAGLLGLLGLIPRKKKTDTVQPVRGTTTPGTGHGAHPTDRDPGQGR